MDRKTKVTQKEVLYLKYLNTENGFSHYSHREDMLQYDYMRIGDDRGLAESAKMFRPDRQGHLSDDPVKNQRYLFIAHTALLSRAAIEGGVQSETAYAISDLYIRRADQLNSVENICLLQQEYYRDLLQEVKNASKRKVISKTTVRCIEYIENHLNQTIHVKELAERLDKNPSYLSTLFKKDMQQSLSDYILFRRIETAKNMLLHSNLSLSQISYSLAFSSQSHFIQTFKKSVGVTPGRYRNSNRASVGSEIQAGFNDPAESG